MSEIANYTFLPWLRQGLANHISGASGLRPTVSIDVTVIGERISGGSEDLPVIHQEIEIYGPGDIVGIEQSAIIKVEPLNWITNFEPNYLPYIEFYDEDFPWRYSPAVPANHRLHPWIMLVVLKDDEFDNGKNIKDRPLPYIRPKAGVKLPPPDQLWAWTHVHVNKNIIGEDFSTNNASDVESKIDALLKSDPDMAYSRIMCPRKLEPNASYHAFLVPVFETGLLAGLGDDPATAAAFDAYAWSDDVTPQELPYYHRWYFRTGSVGDFEYLVRLLEPKPIDSRVGLREMDVQVPGANIQGIIDASDAADEQKLNGILKLGGALRIPDIFYTPEEFAIVEKYHNWATLNGSQPYPHPFQSDLAAFINLTDAYQEKTAQDANADSNINEVIIADDPDTEYDIKQNPDPLITAPLYGRWHALTQRLLKERDETIDIDPNDNWVHDINLDPRRRVAAGFGTAIIQDNQENYMKAAWEQVGDVLESNKKIKNAQLAKEVSWVWHQAYMKPIQQQHTAKWLSLTAPLQSRVLSQGFTVSYQVNQSKLPAVTLSTQMRKKLQPRGRLAKRLQLEAPRTMDIMLDKLNTGTLSAAPLRELPNVATVNDIADAAKPSNAPGFLVNLLNKYPWISWIPLFLALIILLFVIISFILTGVLSSTGISVTGVLLAIYVYFRYINKKLDTANTVLEENQTPESVDAMPSSPDFRISRPEESFSPTLGGGVDSPEAVRFKNALRDVNFTLQESAELGAKPVKPSLNLAGLNTSVFEAVNPEVTIPAWVWGSVLIPGRIKDQLTEDFVEAMVYPEIDYPMYKPLAVKSSELFLPNINFISENSISLLETNQKFIESYMVGLNHEFARELLWREYPTDQRGSYFRQFWDATGYHDTEDLDPEALKEKLRDIPEIHRWLKRSDLGDHDHRESGGDKEEVVLVIRGELLKRYPNAIIYAHKAVWRDEDGEPILDISSGQTIDLTKERDLRPLSETEEQNPLRTIVKTPLYEAKVDPDIYFFGFDLTVCEAQGGAGAEDDPVDERCATEGVQWSDAGWFFVIKERSGEISMGLDVGQEGDNVADIKAFNDVSWNHVTPAVTNGDYLQINNQTQVITLAALDLPDEIEKQEQRDEDLNIQWNKDMSSADLAYVLYQVPVMVAVHAAEMLPNN